MDAESKLSAVFDRGLRDGIESLSPNDRELFLIQDFIIETEMTGLSGYFYNKLPGLPMLKETVAAMRRRGLVQLADILEQGVGLFHDYRDPEVPTTWGKVRDHYDPENVLDVLSRRLAALDNYGLGQSCIA
jgi:hypothetical protein